MRIATILVALVGMAVLVAGCSNCPDSKFANCDVGWDFYEPCDLIQGRSERCCADNPCGIDPCDNGVVMVVNDCVPLSGGPSEAIVLEEEIIEEMPAPEMPATEGK